MPSCDVPPGYEVYRTGDRKPISSAAEVERVLTELNQPLVGLKPRRMPTAAAHPEAVGTIDPPNRDAGNRVLIVKAEFSEKLLSAGVADPASLVRGPLFAGWIEGGRTRHALLRLEDDAWVLKSYRRGGVLGGWNSERYWGHRRFLSELRLAALAQQSGVATAEVLALIFEPAGLGSLRSWTIMRYLPGVRPLFDLYGHPGAGAIFREAGRTVARMHAAGIDHFDLHLGNIVGAIEDDRARTFILDWDRARSHLPGTWNPLRNLNRLWRSVQKRRRNDRLRLTYGSAPGGREAPDDLGRPLRSFVHGYFAGRPAALRTAREYFRRRAFWLGLRVWFGSARR